MVSAFRLSRSFDFPGLLTVELVPKKQGFRTFELSRNLPKIFPKLRSETLVRKKTGIVVISRNCIDWRYPCYQLTAPRLGTTVVGKPAVSTRLKSYLTFVDSSIGVADPLEDKIPIVRFCRVKDLEARIGSKHQMSVGQDVEVTSTNERDLKINKQRSKRPFKTEVVN